MDFHGINTVGKNWLERVSTKPAWDASYEGRIIYASDTETISFATAGEWIDIASATAGGLTNASIPAGAILLFDTDTELSGYSLLEDQNDELVYITKGSGAMVPGEAGGTAKIGSTWTEPIHNHGVGSLVGAGGTHNHKWFNYTTGGDQSFDVNGNPDGLARNNNHGPADAKLVTAADDDLNGTKDFWTTMVTVPVSISGAVANNSVSNDWRPRGRNWTRQQKT